MKVLFIAPLMDLPTITSNMGIFDIFHYAYAKDRNDLDIDFLWGIWAAKPWFNLRNRWENYDGIFYWGHGKPERLVGNFSSMLDKKNIHKMKGKCISTMACWSALRLGRWAIREGADAYIGTIKPYYAAFREPERNFLRDWIDYTTLKDKLLLDGASFGEAYRAFQERGQHYLNIYEKKKGYRNFSWYYKSLKHNLKYTVLLGDPNASLRD